MIPWKVVDKELEWLQDPKELAHRVSNALRAGNVAMGVALVRTAQSRRMECQVAWNTLLEFSMDIGSARSAFRFYNDVRWSSPSQLLAEWEVTDPCIFRPIDEKTRTHAEFPYLYDYVAWSEQSTTETRV